VNSKEQAKQDEAINRKWLRLGADFVRVLGEDQSKWHWKLFNEQKPEAAKLLRRLIDERFYLNFMSRQKSYNLGLISKIFDPLPIRIQLNG